MGSIVPLTLVAQQYPSEQEKMNAETQVLDKAETVLPPQQQVLAALDRAGELKSTGHLDDAVAVLEGALATARATPYELEFLTRIRLGITLSDYYFSAGDFDKANAMLKEEKNFAEKISQLMQATGTQGQKQMATSGYLQIKDRAAQMQLFGKPAPEITVKHWLKGGPDSLESLRGNVVLLEFWATWCKPCQEMFPKLKELAETEAKRGLEVVTITRHYMAYNGSQEAVENELNLMRGMLEKHDVNFHAGVAADETLQATYGANGLPTAILIDREGIVRYAGSGGVDEEFQALLDRYLSVETETASVAGR